MEPDLEVTTRPLASAQLGVNCCCLSQHLQSQFRLLLRPQPMVRTACRCTVRVKKDEDTKCGLVKGDEYKF